MAVVSLRADYRFEQEERCILINRQGLQSLLLLHSTPARTLHIRAVPELALGQKSYR